jgi:hypothetical protein
VNSFLTWLNAQVHILGSVLSAVAANGSAPARQVLIYTAALVLIIWAAIKIAKSASK